MARGKKMRTVAQLKRDIEEATKELLNRADERYKKFTEYLNEAEFKDKIVDYTDSDLKKLAKNVIDKFDAVKVKETVMDTVISEKGVSNDQAEEPKEVPHKEDLVSKPVPKNDTPDLKESKKETPVRRTAEPKENIQKEAHAPKSVPETQNTSPESFLFGNKKDQSIGQSPLTYNPM